MEDNRHSIEHIIDEANKREEQRVNVAAL